MKGRQWVIRDVARPVKPEVRRIDPQYRVTLPESVRRALGLDVDDYVYFAVERDGAVLRKIRF